MSLFAFILAAALPACTADVQARLDATPKGALNKPLEASAPDYPGDAYLLGLTGRVRLAIEVGTDGKGRALCAFESRPAHLFDQAAADAVSSWRWSARPETGVVATTIDFSLEEERASEDFSIEVPVCDAALDRILQRESGRISSKLPEAGSPVSRGEREYYPRDPSDPGRTAVTFLAVSVLPSGRPWLICTRYDSGPAEFAAANQSAAALTVLQWRWRAQEGPESQGLFAINFRFNSNGTSP